MCDFFPEIVHRPRRNMKSTAVLTRLVGRPQRLEIEVGFSHYLTPNWISEQIEIPAYVELYFTKIEFLTLNWVIRRI